MSPKDAYHHGNLRRALLDEALVVIGERGVAELSLRELSARLGVSHAAPYHHFADKAALLHALAHEGMAEMDDVIASAVEESGADPLDRLLALATSYVMFAVEHRDYYLAFTSHDMEGLQANGSGPEEGGGAVWRRLMSVVLECQRAGELPPGDPLVIAVELWSLVHGLAGLWQMGPLRRMPQATDGPRPLVETVLRTTLGMQCQSDRKK